ncbi:hypothetical protein GGR26_002972 [Lewinella marina]|uniref:Aminoglycoside phosphotransferase domain-containing protein n=1 Tax=Neolewinella marina TaxID=438751 RepID=A0A2G0CAS8_9BACT|nr:phosphotransferase [Neolewinella marina]NJB87195.1 hypothetical protein [Neolewinella marina]PHK97076.1 hypothetical protein CGL56_17820 [Neolewinella marina]
MNLRQIELLQRNPTLAGSVVRETHISWLLLLPDKVYKMKKGVRFSFLDFSTLQRRKHYCQRELALNRRLAPDLYEAVVAVNPSVEGLTFGPRTPQTVDYAVRMRRVAARWELANLLSHREVTAADMRRIARQLAVFHRRNVVTDVPFDERRALRNFIDVGNYPNELEPHLGASGLSELYEGGDLARLFLRRRGERLRERARSGYTVDGHGDLHVGNVFVEHGNPILFDCIEFDDAMRRIDVLDEVAFLYVDLEARGRRDLAEQFANHYQRYNPSMHTEEDRQLFDYYRCYRAGVRLKVTALKMNRTPESKEETTLLNRYHQLYCAYARALEQSGSAARKPVRHPT